MKTGLLLTAMLFACMSMRGHTSSSAETGQEKSKEQLVISFNFQRGGIASSQYAIWIENEKGELIRTLYAISFTVKGGYEYRKDAIPD